MGHCRPIHGNVRPIVIPAFLAWPADGHGMALSEPFCDAPPCAFDVVLFQELLKRLFGIQLRNSVCVSSGDLVCADSNDRLFLKLGGGKGIERTGLLDFPRAMRIPPPLLILSIVRLCIYVLRRSDERY
jgi:hypothetical protein